jgi:hypothetical protein
VEIHLENPIALEGGATVRATPISLDVTVDPSDGAALSRFCQATLTRLLAARTYESALDAAYVLAYVRDPEAIPYLERAFQVSDPVQALFVEGLEAIATDQAIEALLRVTEKASPTETWGARDALRRLAARTNDPGLRARILARIH